MKSPIHHRLLCAAALLPLVGGCDIDSDDQRRDEADDRVIDGQDAPAGSYNFMGMMDNGVDFCSMVAIHPEWILTAAHCIYDDDNNFVLRSPLAQWDAVVGRTLLSDNNDGVEVDFDQAHRLHPPNAPYTTQFDLALVHITSPLPGSHVAEIAPTEPGAGEAVRILGYGQTEHGVLAGRLKFRDVTRRAVCFAGTFCTEAGVGAGDSGGATVNGQGQLVGINAARLFATESEMARPIMYRGWIETILPDRHQSQYILTQDGIRYRQGLTGGFSDYPAAFTPGEGEMQAVSRFVAYPGNTESVVEYLFRGGEIWLRESPASAWAPSTLAPVGRGWTNVASITEIDGCDSGELRFFNTKVDRTRGNVAQGFGCGDDWYARSVSIVGYVHPWEAGAGWSHIGTEAQWLDMVENGGLSTLKPQVANDAEIVMGSWAYERTDLSDMFTPTERHYQSIGFDKSAASGAFAGWYRIVDGNNWDTPWIGPTTAADIGTGINEVQGAAVLDLR
ncbi:MAG: S1 family peptidase [Deltaproteobacteria bacterium]|nr:S1 family peptidase [Deltaproteobacteria bacterium]